LQISINYTGKLKENGAEVESNAGQASFKFRLGNISLFTRNLLLPGYDSFVLTLALSFAGKGEVIEGLDIGLEGSHLNILSLLFSLIKVFFSFNFINSWFSGMRVGEKRRLIIPPSMTYVIEFMC
jgi:FKBP-type peptidyl-prolyl cis-trans isomerase 2